MCHDLADRSVELRIFVAFEKSGQVAISEEAGKPAFRIDQHDRAGSTALDRGFQQDLSYRFAIGSDTALVQTSHDLFDLAQLLAQRTGWVETGKILFPEAIHSASDQRHRVANGEHDCRAGARGQAQGACFFEVPYRKDNRRRTTERALGPGCNRDDRHAKLGKCRQNLRYPRPFRHFEKAEEPSRRDGYVPNRRGLPRRDAKSGTLCRSRRVLP